MANRTRSRRRAIADDLPPLYALREAEEPFRYNLEYQKWKDLFTIRVHAEGKFKKFRGARVYVDGWVTCADNISKDNVSMLLLCDIAEALGLWGACWFYYKKPFSTVGDGVFRLITNEDLKDFVAWVPGVRVMDVYVTHPSNKMVVDDILNDMYWSLRRMWPKAVVEEIVEVEGVEKDSVELGCPLLPWYPVGEEDRVEVGAVENDLGVQLLPWYPVGEEGVHDHVGVENDVEVEVEKVADVVIEEGDVENADVENADVEPADVENAGVQNVEPADVSFDGGEWMSDLMGGLSLPSQLDADDTFDLRCLDDDFIPTEDVEGEEDADVEDNGGVEDNGDDGGSSDDSVENHQHGEPGFCYPNEEEAYNDLGPVCSQYEVEDSDENHSNCSDELEDLQEFELEDDDGTPTMIPFNKNKHVNDPILTPSMLFGNAGEFRSLIRALGVKTRKPLWFKKNQRWKVGVRCRNEGCPFYVFCSRIGKTNNLSIKTIDEQHICGTAVKNSLVTCEYLAQRYVEKVRMEPKVAIGAFIAQVSQEIGVQISVAMAWRAIKAAGFLIYGNETQQFAKLWSYGQYLLKINPMSTVRIKLDDQKFQRFYICPGELKEGFKAGCRKFICLDGCFLKGTFKGQLLAAVGVDANNGIYPVAWAVVEVENTESWTWFVGLLREDLDMDIAADQWVLMTDQQKGLENAIARELPVAEHRLCVKHLHANWSKRFGGKTFKDMMWEAARAANEPYFLAAMNAIKMVSQEAHDALDRIPRSKWTRCGFRQGTNCPMLVNNWAEAFNVFIIKAREQPIISMLNTIYDIIMTRLYTQSTKAEKWGGDICPRVNKTILEREKLSQGYIVGYAGNAKHTVKTAHHQWTVDLAKVICSCGLWQLGGVPCIHAVSVYHSQGMNPRLYVHKDFKKSTFESIYSHFLQPVEGPIFWPSTNLPEILAPEVRVLPGRPKRKRTKDPSELREQRDAAREEEARKRREEGSLSYKRSKKGTLIHCKKCGVVGHNAKTCRQPRTVDSEAGSSRQPRKRARRA